MCLLWFLQLTKLAAENLTFILQKVVLQRKLMIYPLHIDPGLVCKANAFLLEFSLTATLRSLHKGLQCVLKCRFSTQGFGVAHGPAGGILRWDYPNVLGVSFLRILTTIKEELYPFSAF